MRKMVAAALLVLGASSWAFGALQNQTPEIDAGSAAAAVGLIAGALLVLRARRNK